MARRAADTAATPALLVAATARLIGVDATASDRFGIAVSGGPDSMALLLLANAAFPGRIAAATVDHRLRRESAAEAAFVASECAARTIAHSILTPDQPITGNLQSAARAARYALLERWRIDQGIDWLMTAHHADDQAETLLMRLNRASGVGGLSGIRARNGVILRPLLGIRRSALADVVKGAGINAVADPSNHDRQFDRVRIRQWLGQHDGGGDAETHESLDPVAISASAAHLADAEAALDWAASRLAKERVSHTAAGSRLDTRGLPDELLRRLLIGTLLSKAPDLSPPRGEAIDALIAKVQAGQRAMIADLMIDADPSDPSIWIITNAPPRRAGR